MTVLVSGSVTVLLKVTNSIIQSDDLTVASGDDDLTIIETVLRFHPGFYLL